MEIILGIGNLFKMCDNILSRVGRVGVTKITSSRSYDWIY
jgi:hypothetical protein